MVPDLSAPAGEKSVTGAHRRKWGKNAGKTLKKVPKNELLETLENRPMKFDRFAFLPIAVNRRFFGKKNPIYPLFSGFGHPLPTFSRHLCRALCQ